MINFVDNVPEDRSLVALPHELPVGHAIEYGDVWGLSDHAAVGYNVPPWSGEFETFLILSAGTAVHMETKTVRWRVELMNSEGEHFTYMGDKPFDPSDRETLVRVSTESMLS